MGDSSTFRADNSVQKSDVAGARLRGPSLLLVRIVWFFLALAALGLFVAVLPAFLADLRTPCPPRPPLAFLDSLILQRPVRFRLLASP